MSGIVELKSTKGEKSLNSTVNSEHGSESEKSPKPLAKPKKRCSSCRKKLGLTGKLLVLNGSKFNRYNIQIRYEKAQS